ncbi:hypothetical protein [Sphingomonas mollis]|uniref:Uncharacterized protein n=1 Tax=Sphingomonas mollis TaxID=2795726 RepID=A0ABS0XPG6_9SPHN|nr:hypothetical protein [Sphingomonas sp. BT553]MBJ6121942.1 hypothetical protein [Sphingomonas sp. BT553]
MSPDDRDDLSVYLIFSEPDDRFYRVVRSVAGAGYAVLRYASLHRNVIGLVPDEVGPFNMEMVDAALPMDAPSMCVRQTGAN